MNDQAKARKLLAAEFDACGFHGSADDARGPHSSPMCAASLRAISAALRSAPEGYVLVPVEPTDEMTWAPCDVEVGYPTWAGSRECCTTDEAKAIWAAMIAARPGEGA